MYGATSGQLIQRVQKCINFCARVLSGKRKYDHISGTLRSLGWLSARQLHDFYSLTTLRRVTQASEPEALAELFVRNCDVHTRNTSSARSFHPPRIKTEFGRKRFAFRAAMAYNALPVHVCELAQHRKAFGKALKEHILSDD